MPAASAGTVSHVADAGRFRGAWQGRISGCLLGKPLEVLSFEQGRGGIESYLKRAHAFPLGGYVPLVDGTVVARREPDCCAGRIRRAEPDDDIDYSLLALALLERFGATFGREDVARQWLRLLPAGRTWTAERAAYHTLLDRMDDEFVNGAAPGFDLDACSDNPFCEWIGAQIRADVYGWVLPGRPGAAAALAVRDGALSHRGEALHAAAFVAALGALLGAGTDVRDAIAGALATIPEDSQAADAVRLARSLAGTADAVDVLEARYASLSPVHSINNLAVVVWAMCDAEGDFDRAVCSAVQAGWDTDCNGATVGGLCGIAGWPIDERWTAPWRGRIGAGLAGIGELELEDVVARTANVARLLEGTRDAQFH
ncbi:MAG: ADP-ribosylglycohydrolase family protein [Pseudomonadota bacterium]